MNKIITSGLGPEIKVIMESADNNEVEEQSVMETGSMADQPVDYTEYIQSVVFVGEYPFDVIIEGITNQFSNYISTEDRIDYVDIFYKQYQTSLDLIIEQDFPDDAKDGLETYLNKFLATMQNLFYTKLSLTLADLEGEDLDYDESEKTIRLLYDFFILNCRKNFKTAILKSCYSDIDPDLEDRLFYSRIREILTNYSPVIMIIGPMEFIRLCNNTNEIYELFDTGRVVGNFLRKFSPRLYQNEEFECEIIAYITSVIELYKETRDIEISIRKEEEKYGTAATNIN